MLANLRSNPMRRRSVSAAIGDSGPRCLRQDDDFGTDDFGTNDFDAEQSADDQSEDGDEDIDADEELFDPEQGDLLGDFGLDPDEVQPEYGDFELGGNDDDDDDWRAFD